MVTRQTSSTFSEDQSNKFNPKKSLEFKSHYRHRKRVIPFARATTFTRGLPDVAGQLRILARERPLGVQHLLDAAELTRPIGVAREVVDGDEGVERLLRNIASGSTALERLAAESKPHLAPPLFQLLITHVESLRRHLDPKNQRPKETAPISPTPEPYQKSPTMDEVNDYLVTRLSLVARENPSTVVRQGLYLLLALGITPEMLTHFWEHLQNLGHLRERERALQLIAHLYARRASGYDYGFRPMRVDERFFSADTNYIQSVLALLEVALGYAAHPRIDRVAIGKVMTYDETKLSRRLRGFLATHVDPFVGEKRSGWKIEEASTPVDLFITTTRGTQRLVKVKTNLSGDLGAAGQVAQFFSPPVIGQAIYLSLVVQEHQLEGIEYHFQADRPPNETPQALEEALTMTGIPFVIRFWQQQQIVWESRRRLKPLPYHSNRGNVEEPIQRPLPPLPSA